MNERKKLKKHLGDKYIFKMYLSVKIQKTSTTLCLLHSQSAV